MAEATNRALGVIADRVPGASKDIDGLRAVVDRLAIQYGVSQDQIIQTMDATSKAGQSNAEDLIAVTEAAVQAGKALGVNGVELVENLDTVLDIFGIAAKDTAAAVAQFFAAAEGKTTLTDLLDSLSKLAPVVQGTGIDALTAAQALSKLIGDGFEPGKKVIAEFKEVLKNGGVPAIQALAAAAPITTDAVNSFTDAINRNSTDIESNVQRSQSQLKAALIDLGTTLTPIIAKVTSFAAILLKALLSSKGGGLTGAMIDIQVAAAGLSPALQGVADATGDLGKAGGIAAGAVGALSAAQREAVSSSKSLTDEQKAGILTATTLTDVQRKQLQQALKETADAAEASAKRQATSRKALFEMEQKFSGAMINLAKAQAQQVEALQIALNESLANLRGRDLQKGLKIAEEAKAALGEKWKQVYDFLNDTIVPKVQIMTTEVTKLKLSHTDLNAAVDRGGIAYRKIGTDLDDAAKKQQALREKIAATSRDVADAVDVFGALAKAIGLSSPELDSVVAGIADVADAIGRVASGDLAGGLIQGISGLSGVISGLFGGESESARRVREALEENRRSLDDLSRNIGDLNINLTGDQIAGVKGAVGDFLASGGANEKGWADRLNKFLKDWGLTMADLDEVAKKLGIELRPGGHLSPEAIQQVFEGLGLIEPTTFPNTFRGQRAKDRAKADLFDSSAEEQASDEAKTAARFTKGGVSAAFAGFDFSTPEGRAAAKKIVEGWFENFEDIPIGELGGLTPLEFLEVMQNIMDWIDSIQEEIDSTNGEIGDTGGTPPPTTGTPPPPEGEEPPTNDDPLPIEDPVFTPTLETANWESLLGFQQEGVELLAGILEAIGPPSVVPPPSLPPGALGGGGANVVAGGGIQIHGPISVQVVSTGDPEADGRAAGQAFLDQLDALDAGMGRRFQAQRFVHGSVSRS